MRWILLSLLLAAPLAFAQVSGELTPEASAMRLRDAVQSRNPAAWEREEKALAQWGAEALPQLELLAAAHDYRERFLACRVAARIAREAEEESTAETATAIVLEGLGDQDPSVRSVSRDLIRDLRPAAAVPILIARLEHAREREQEEIVEALQDLTRIPIGFAKEAWDAWWEEAAEGFEPAPPREQIVGAGEGGGVSYHGHSITSRHVVFVVDRSLSMEWGGRFERAKIELSKTINSLPEDVQFSIIFYGARLKVWSSSLKPASSRNKKRAVHWVMEQETIPSTATFEALATAFEIDGVETIYLLSDGDPNVGRFTTPDAICREIRAVNTFRRVRIYTIGFFFGEVPPQYRTQARSTDRTRDFMRRLAKENRGHFAEIDE